MTPNFTLAELTVTEHRRLKNEPNPSEIANLQRLAELLEQVKVAIGGKPVMVNSAFRSKQVNDAVGRRDTSQHRLGCAADIRVPGMAPDAVVKAIIAAKLPFDQLIREFDSWTHISIPNDPKGKPRGQVLIIDSKGTRTF